MKSLLGILLTSAIIFSLIFTISCNNGGDEPKPLPETLAGKYKFTKIALTKELVVTEDSSAARTVTLPVGTDVTEMSLQGMVGTLQCNDVSNAAIDLRDNHELYAFCNGEGGTPVKGGTWNENADLTELTLNLAPPLVPVAVALIQTNIQKNGDNLSGDVTSLPMGGALMEMYPPPGITYPDKFKFPAFIPLDVNIKYTKLK